MPRSRTGPSPLPPRRLFADDVIALRLHRVVGGGHSPRPDREQFYAHITEYWFTIHRRRRRQVIGRIGFRIANDAILSYTIGHVGYSINEAHRRQGYATRALRLVVGLARHWRITPLWILIEPHNIASRRTAENAGFTFIDIIGTPPQVMALGCGPQLCRYEIHPDAVPSEAADGSAPRPSQRKRFLKRPFTFIARITFDLFKPRR